MKRRPFYLNPPPKGIGFSPTTTERILIMKGPLNGITVIDMSRVLAGPFTAMVLADLGARVIKVEAPGKGDDSRSFPPIKDGVSAYFSSVNRGKESIALNLKDEKDKGILLKMLEKADVIVENFRPGVMERLGLGWDVLKDRYPRLIYAASSGFGHTGPYSKRAAYDMVVQAMGGIMSITGHPGESPIRIGTSIGDLTAALYTVIGVVSAIYDRLRTGKGCKIDVSMLDCQVAFLENAIARYLLSGIVPEPLGGIHPSICPFGVFKTQDSYVIIVAGNDHLFEVMANSIEMPELLEDPRYKSNPERCAHKWELKEDMEKALAKKTTAEWLKILEKAGIPFAPINDIRAVVEDPQINERNMIVEVEDPDAGTIKMAGNPIKMSSYEDPHVRRRAPHLDENREALLKEFGITE